MSNYLDGKYKTFQEIMTGITPYYDTPSLISLIYNAQNRFIEKTSISPNVIFLGRQEKKRLKEAVENVSAIKNANLKRFNSVCGLKIRFTRKSSEVTPALILGAL